MSQNSEHNTAASPSGKHKTPGAKAQGQKQCHTQRQWVSLLHPLLQNAQEITLCKRTYQCLDVLKVGISGLHVLVSGDLKAEEKNQKPSTILSIYGPLVIHIPVLRHQLCTAYNVLN